MAANIRTIDFSKGKFKWFWEIGFEFFAPVAIALIFNTWHPALNPFHTDDEIEREDHRSHQRNITDFGCWRLFGVLRYGSYLTAKCAKVNRRGRREIRV